MLPRGRHSDDGEKNRRVVARGDEKLHRETAGLQRALEREIRGANWTGAASVAGSGGGFRARLRDETIATISRFRRPSRALFYSETFYPEFRCASLRALILRASGAGQDSAIRLPLFAKRRQCAGSCSQVSDSNLSRSACWLRPGFLPRSRKPSIQSAIRHRSSNTWWS